MKRKVKQPEKLNLIPILDAVFIFIFFLLMSAQFVEIHKIDTTAPIVKSSAPSKSEKKPLNLKLSISKTHVTISKGTNDTIVKKLSLKSEIDQLGIELKKIKQVYPREKEVTLVPSRDISYKNVIKVIDRSKFLDTGKERVELFPKIAFLSR